MKYHAQALLPEVKAHISNTANLAGLVGTQSYGKIFQALSLVSFQEVISSVH